MTPSSAAVTLKTHPDALHKGTKVSPSLSLFMAYAFKKNVSHTQKYRRALIE